MATTAEDLLRQAAEAIRADREQLERERAEVAAGAELMSESYVAQLAERVGVDAGIQRERIRCLALVEQQLEALAPTGVAAIPLRRLREQISGGEEPIITTTGEHHG
jgi:hypothetical protein